MLKSKGKQKTGMFRIFSIPDMNRLPDFRRPARHNARSTYRTKKRIRTMDDAAEIGTAGSDAFLHGDNFPESNSIALAIIYIFPEREKFTNQFFGMEGKIISIIQRLEIPFKIFGFKCDFVFRLRGRTGSLQEIFIPELEKITVRHYNTSLSFVYARFQTQNQESGISFQSSQEEQRLCSESYPCTYPSS